SCFPSSVSSSCTSLFRSNAADPGPRTPFLDLDWDDWDRVLATNLTAPAQLSQEAARAMATHGRGAIINLTAIQERLPMMTYSARSEEHTSELQSRFDLVC